jgi:hypothetical protein
MSVVPLFTGISKLTSQPCLATGVLKKKTPTFGGN